MDTPHPHSGELAEPTEAQRQLRERIERNDPDVTAAEYDAFVLSRGRDQVACVVRDLVGDIRQTLPLHDVLEIAMGTGIVTQRLRELPQLSLVGVDVRAAWMRYAMDHGRIGEGQAVCADFEALPFAAERFDLCTGIAFLNHRKDPIRFYQEMHRVLRPNGAMLLPWVKAKIGSVEREAELMIEHGFRILRREAWYVLGQKS